MKNLALIISFIGLCAFANAQNTDAVEKAFKSGNASELSKHLAPEVELNIGDDVHFLSTSEIVKTLDQWFSKVKPSGFNGKIAGGSSVKYYSGHLKSSDGSYKILIYFDTHKESYKVDEIRITKH